jgi:hypothetical protein
MRPDPAPIAFLVAFPLFWLALAKFFARISGWSALAARFPAGERPDGERVFWTSAQIGGVSFKNCLNLTVADSGLHLAPTFLFRTFMPALLIPWREVRFSGFRRWFFVEFAVFSLGPDRTSFAVWPKTGELLIPRLDEKSRADHAARTKHAEPLMSAALTKISIVAAVLGLIAAFVASRAGR